MGVTPHGNYLVKFNVAKPRSQEKPGNSSLTGFSIRFYGFR